MEMQANKLVNTVEFRVDRSSFEKTKKAYAEIKQMGEKMKDPFGSAKKYRQDMTDAANKVRQAKAAGVSEDKKAAAQAARVERAINKAYVTETALKNLTHLTAQEQAGVMHQVGKTVAMYERAEISLGRQNALIGRQMQEARALNRLRQKEVHTAKEKAFIDRVGDRLTGIGKGALGALGLAGGAAYAGYAAYSKARETITNVGDTQGELVSRAKLGNTNINLVRALSSYATANGIDSGMGEQGQIKILDNSKDIVDRIGNTKANATYDSKSKKWKGGDQNITGLMNNYGYTKENLSGFEKDPFALVSSVVNTMQKQGKSYAEIFSTIESFADDLSLYTGAFLDDGKNLKVQFQQLSDNGALLSKAQQDQILKYHSMGQAVDQITDGNNVAFFTGFMKNIDPDTMKKFTDAMTKLNPLYEDLGKAAGSATSGLMKLATWLGEQVASSNANKTPTPLVKPETKQSMDSKASSYTDEKYGIDSSAQSGDWASEIRQSIYNLFGMHQDAPAVATPSLGFDASRYSQQSQNDALMSGLQNKYSAGQNFNLNTNLTVPDQAFQITIDPTSEFGRVVDAHIDSKLRDFSKRQALEFSSGVGF